MEYALIIAMVSLFVLFAFLIFSGVEITWTKETNPKDESKETDNKELRDEYNKVTDELVNQIKMKVRMLYDHEARIKVLEDKNK